MRLRDIMSHPVETIGPEEAAERAQEQMRLRRIHHLVVVVGKRPVGIVSARDLGRSGMTSATRVSEVMTPDPVTASPDSTVREVANRMRGRSIGCIPVVERNAVVGMVTVTDLLELIGRGVERPVAKTKRWTLRRRGVRPKTYP